MQYSSAPESTARGALLNSRAMAIQKLAMNTPRGELRNMIDRQKAQRAKATDVMSDYTTGARMNVRDMLAQQQGKKEGIYQSGLDTLKADPSQWMRDGAMPTVNPFTPKPVTGGSMYQSPANSGAMFGPNLPTGSTVPATSTTTPSISNTMSGAMNTPIFFGNKAPSPSGIRAGLTAQLSELDKQVKLYESLSPEARRTMQHPDETGVVRAGIQRQLQNMTNMENSARFTETKNLQEQMRKLNDAKVKKQMGLPLTPEEEALISSEGTITPGQSMSMMPMPGAGAGAVTAALAVGGTAYGLSGNGKTAADAVSGSISARDTAFKDAAGSVKRKQQISIPGITPGTTPTSPVKEALFDKPTDTAQTSIDDISKQNKAIAGTAKRLSKLHEAFSGVPDSVAKRYEDAAEKIYKPLIESGNYKSKNEVIQALADSNAISTRASSDEIAADFVKFFQSTMANESSVEPDTYKQWLKDADALKKLKTLLKASS